MRPGEWIAVRRADHDLTGSPPSVTVKRRRTKDGKFAPPKNGAPRRIPLRPRVIEALQARPPRIDSPLLFPGKRGCMNLKAFARDHWEPALESAGFEHRGLYSLRHTFATWCIAEGLNTFQVSRLLGTGLENVDLHYGHLLRDADQATIAAMNRFDGRQVDPDENAETA